MNDFIDKAHQIFDYAFKSITIIISGIVVMKYAEVIHATYDPVLPIYIIKYIGILVSIFGFVLGTVSIIYGVSLTDYKNNSLFKNIISFVLYLSLVICMLIVIAGWLEISADKLFK